MRAPQIHTLESLEKVSRHALELLDTVLKTTDRKVTLALSGGSTPKRLYEMMAESSLPLQRLEFFFGDERFVPHDHPDSNFRMAREALFDHVKTIPAEHIHPWPYLGSAQASADAYEELLTKRFGKDVGFDVVLLGMGDDGHTASLFPGTEALKVTDRSAVANHVAKLDTWRLTVTYPVFERSKRVWFLICGASKAEVLPHVIHGERVTTGGGPGEVMHHDEGPAGQYPSSHVRSGGELVFMIDRAAGAKL